MKTMVITAIVAVTMAVSAHAQTVPDLKGTWSGQWKTVIYGINPHHPGPQAAADAPRIREITFTLEIEGQDGRLFWGKSWSRPEQKESFAAAVTPDGKTIVGADTDGSLTGTIVAPDRMEMCYAHSALSPSKSIVASCGVVQRSR
jgi:hypothetical protein